MIDSVVEMVNLFTYCKSFEGKDQIELIKKLGISSQSKSLNYILSNKIVENYKGKGLSQFLLTKENVHIKTIQLNEQGKAKESMSFSPINYMQLVNEDWINSTFRNYLSGRFLFFVFKISGDKNYLYKTIFWNMPDEDLDGEAKYVWEDVKSKLLTGNLIKKIDDKTTITNFLCGGDTNICHVRPHARNRNDVAEVPVADKSTGYKYLIKQSFWFNHEYLDNIISNN